MSVPSALRAAAAFALVPAVFAPAFAQESVAKPPLRHDVVVTAARLETALLETASSIVVLTRAELAATRQTSVLEAVRDALGLAVARNGGPGSASSVFLRGANSEHLLVLLDGVPLNDPINPSRSYDLAHLTLDAVDRIEILRGPQSPLYGTDALAGVINILTARGSGPARLLLRFSGGSRDRLESGLDLRGSKGSFHYAVGLSRESTRGVSAAGASYPGNTEDDGYRNWTLAGRTGFTLAGGTEIDLIIRGISARTDIDAYGGPYGDDPNSVQAYASGLARVQARSLFFGGRWESKLGLSLLRSLRDHDNAADPDHPFETETGRYRSRLLRLDWQNHLFLNGRHTITFGTDAERETGESSYLSDSPWGAYESAFAPRRAGRAGIYLQDRIRIENAVFATAGVRFDVHERAGSVLTFRIAPAHVVAKTGTKIKGTVGTGFKAPSLYQLYAPGTLWGPVGNAGLAAEKSLGWDAGLEQPLAGGTVLVGATYFRTLYRNLVDFDFARGYVNVGRALTKGWEVEGEIRPGRGLVIKAAYTRLEALNLQDGTALPRRPKDKISGSLRWAFSPDGAVSLSAARTGPRTDRDYSGWAPREVILPGYTLVDAVLSFSPVERIEMFLRLDNILDTRYETVFGYGTPGFTAAAGFNLRL